MELRKEIEILLESLKGLGLERGEIEQELNYSENYIDQVLSKGGNRRFLIQLKKLKNEVLQKPIQQSHGTEVSTTAIQGQPLSAGSVKIDLQDYIDLLKYQKEQAEKEKAEYLAIIKENLTALAINSSRSLEDLSTVIRILRSDDGVIMDNQDEQAGREPGESSTKAGRIEISSAIREKEMGKPAVKRR